MGLKITGLNELRERLERLRPEEVMAKALAEQARRVAARVREGLSEPPGGAGHNEPWLQSGALRDSVGAQAEGLQAAVGSSDPAAVPQELGTSRMPARPFLAPVAAEMGEEVARAVAAAVVAALRGDSPDAGSARVDLCGDGPDGGDPLYGGAIAGGGAPVSTGSAKAPGAGGHARPAARRPNTGGFDPSGVRLASDSGEHPEDPDDVPAKKDLEFPGHAHTHTPQPMPGLNSPFPKIPLPITPGRGPMPAAPRPVAPGSAAPTRQPPAQTAPSSPAAFGRTDAEYDALARDPAQGGASSLKTEQERRVGLELEKRGDVPGPITRDPSGRAEFIDAKGNKWDVKGFNSYYRPSEGGFRLQTDANKVDKSLREGENVMLDTSKMTPNDIAALKAEGAARGWGDKVVYWP